MLSARAFQNIAVEEARRSPEIDEQQPVSGVYWFACEEMTEALLLSLKIQKDGSDSKDFLFGEFRIDRERETVLTQPFGNGEVARFVTEMRVGLLQVNRHRIVDGRLDAGIVQDAAHPVAFWSFDNITMPHAF